MKVFGRGVGLGGLSALAAYGVALAPSLDGFLVGATHTTPAEKLIVPVAIVVAVVGLGIGLGAAKKKSVSRVAVLLWIVLVLFLMANVPWWTLTDAATKQILFLVATIGVYAGAATWAGQLFNDGAILHAMRGIVLVNATVTVVQFVLSLILHREIVMPWQTLTLLNSYRPCGWFREPAQYGAYVALWTSLDNKRPTLAGLVTVLLALLAGGSVISLLALILIVAPWTKLYWRRKGPIAAVLAALLTLGTIVVALRFPAVQSRLSYLNSDSMFTRVTKTPLVLSYLWHVSSAGIVFGYGPVRVASLISGYEGSFSVRVLSSGSFLSGWGQGIAWLGIVGVVLCWFIWIVASRRGSSRWKVASVAVVLAVLQAGADISPTYIIFWIPALIMSGSTPLYGVRNARRSDYVTPGSGPALRRQKYDAS